MTDLSHLQFGTARGRMRGFLLIEAAYANSGNPALRHSAAQGFELARALAGARRRQTRPAIASFVRQQPARHRHAHQSGRGFAGCVRGVTLGHGQQRVVGYPSQALDSARSVLLSVDRRGLLEVLCGVLERSRRAPRLAVVRGHAHRFRPQRRAERGARAAITAAPLRCSCWAPASGAVASRPVARNASTATRSKIGWTCPSRRTIAPCSQSLRVLSSTFRAERDSQVFPGWSGSRSRSCARDDLHEQEQQTCHPRNGSVWRSPAAAHPSWPRKRTT